MARQLYELEKQEDGRITLRWILEE